MKKPNTTPGPWRTHLVDSTVVVAEHHDVCTMSGDYPLAYDRMEADAKLIAASPMLAEALYAIMRDLPSNRDWLDPVTEVMAKDALIAAGYEARP